MARTEHDKYDTYWFQTCWQNPIGSWNTWAWLSSSVSGNSCWAYTGVRGLQALMESKASEDALSLQASAELEKMGRQKSGPMQLEDTQVLAALANMDSFGTSSDDLVSEPSGEVSRQVRTPPHCRSRALLVSLFWWDIHRAFIASQSVHVPGMPAPMLALVDQMSCNRAYSPCAHDDSAHSTAVLTAPPVHTFASTAALDHVSVLTRQHMSALQPSGDSMSRQKSAEGRRRRLQAAAELAKQRSASEELLKDVEVAANQTAQDLAAMTPPSKAEQNQQKPFKHASTESDVVRASIFADKDAMRYACRVVDYGA